MKGKAETKKERKEFQEISRREKYGKDSVKDPEDDQVYRQQVRGGLDHRL